MHVGVFNLINKSHEHTFHNVLLFLGNLVIIGSVVFIFCMHYLAYQTIKHTQRNSNNSLLFVV